MGEGMAGNLDRGTLYDSENDAAYAANRMAQYAAEDALDDNAKFLAEQDIERAHEEAQEAIAEFRALAATIKGKTYDDPVCNLVRRELRSLRYQVTTAIQTIKERRNDYYSAVIDY